MSETKEESNSTSSDLKQDENSSKVEETKNVDESSKDSVKDDSVKEESGKDKSDEDDEDDDDEEEMGLLDRPVEVTGCRARKQVERLEVSFNAPKEKPEFQDGKGQKLGDCPRIEHQIQKTAIEDLKPMHKMLFGRVGSANKIKKSIRKFSGFPFSKNSTEFERKKAATEKLTLGVLKKVCEVLDIERGGTKEEIVMRILDFLLEPKDSGKKIPTKKKIVKEKKKSSAKKTKNKKVKTKIEVESDDEDDDDSENESASEKQPNIEEEDDDDESDYDTKKKVKSVKVKKTLKKTTASTTKKSDKKEKAKKEEKSSTTGTKRKRDDDDSDSSDEEPIAKKNKVPSDDEIKKLVKRILDAADLQEITMKKVIKQVADAYPDCDLSHKKAFIKTTIKSVIS